MTFAALRISSSGSPECFAEGVPYAFRQPSGPGAPALRRLQQLRAVITWVSHAPDQSALFDRDRDRDRDFVPVLASLAGGGGRFLTGSSSR